MTTVFALRFCQCLLIINLYCWQREEIQTALGISLDTKVHLGSLRDFCVAHEHHGVLPEKYKHPDVMRRLEVAAIKILDHVVSGYHHTRYTVVVTFYKYSRTPKNCSCLAIIDHGAVEIFKA